MPSDLSPTEQSSLAGQLGSLLNRVPEDAAASWEKQQREAQSRALRQVALDAALKVVILSPQIGHATHAKAVLETARRFHRFLTA